jgi:hypothetical protein
LKKKEYEEKLRKIAADVDKKSKNDKISKLVKSAD